MSLAADASSLVDVSVTVNDITDEASVRGCAMGAGSKDRLLS